MSTYVVYCSRGLNREICQFTIQNKIHCVECSNARYVLRQKTEDKKEETNSDDNIKDGK